MDLKINDNSVKKLETKNDTELAKAFLTKKHIPLLNFDVLSDESLRIREMRTQDRSVKYPYYCSLQGVERAFFLTQVMDKYYSLVHDPKKYDLKLEPVVALYNEMLADNWITFDRERLKAEKEAKDDGLEKRDFTFEYNLDMITKILNLISSIDLSQTNNLSL